MGTRFRKDQKLKTFKMCGTSLALISDNFLLFTLLLIFLHSVEHGSHELADLFKSISEINSVFLLIIYFQPAAVITSNAEA